MSRALIITACACAALVPEAAAEWGNSRGGPERDGVRAGTGDLPAAQVVWRHRLGGNLGSSAMWSFADPVAPRVAAVFGGRMSLARWDDTGAWSGDLHGVETIQGVIDIDRDGAIDLILASGSGSGSVLVGYTPDGIAAFTAPAGLLGPITTGLRVADLDGDGLDDLYVAPFRPGADGELIAAFRFPAGPGSGELMYTIDAEHRDYFGGFYDVIAELDGTPGLEIMALGRNRIYLYDAATGALESTSDDLGPIPFARATLRAVDVDGDGVSEVFGFSNQAWSASSNRRYVALFAHDGERMAARWRRDVADVVADAVAFSDSSAGDLDGDGRLEVSYALYSAAADRWTTEVRDAATGVLLDSVAGRYVDVAESLVLVGGDGEPLEAYRFSPGVGLVRAGSADPLSIVRCRVQTAALREAARFAPCRTAPGVILAGETDPASGRITAVRALDTAAGLATVARFDGAGGFITGVVEIGPTQPAVIAVAHSDGVIIPLDADLRRLPPSPKPPYAWGGRRFGTAFSGVDLAPFPLVLPPRPDSGDGGGGERVLAISGGRAFALDASGDPSVGGGAEVVWSALGAGRAVVAGDRVALFDNAAGVVGLDAGDGSEAWRIEGYFGDRGLHNDPLLVRRDGGDQLWFHRRDRGGRYDLTAVDAATGQIAFHDPELDTNDSGWRRLSLAREGGEPVPLSGRLSQIWRFDAAGAVRGVHDARAIISLPAPVLGDPIYVQVDSQSLSAFDPIADRTAWTLEHRNTLRARLGAMLNVGGAARYATGQNGSPRLRVIDVETGAVIWAAALAGGAVHPVGAPVGAPPPVLSNTAAITDLDGSGEPAYLVGASDGFLYAISALDHRLIWSLDVGAPVGEVVPVDWDGDGLLELVASTSDGALVGVDRYRGDAPAWVRDTGADLAGDDIDELATNRTLYATWAPVDGATGYQLAVFTNGGEPVTAGFGGVGDVTSAQITDLSLEPGVRYVVAVRALSALGTSGDTPSDGVTVLPTGDTGAGCCQVSGRRGALEAVLMVLICAVALRRRRRRPRRRSTPVS